MRRPSRVFALALLGLTLVGLLAPTASAQCWPMCGTPTDSASWYWWIFG
ncbi:MAG: hypothetical protein KY455_01995 [Euryarchaeota archaeon]|nr:hypothetical protein [Euryarchaeota archaeon]